MSFDSPSDNIEKEFPGLYGMDSSIGLDDDHDKQSKKKDKKDKKDKQKDKKDKGYMMFEEDDEGNAIDDAKSPGKTKKSKPPFKFQKKDIFLKSKDKDVKKEGKEKRKEDKESKKDKMKSKDKKKSKHGLVTPHITVVVDKPVFGVPLAQAVERNKCHDGIELPALVRECIDYIEEYGLNCEGIYRISGVKSKVQQLKDSYNKGLPADLYEHEPSVVASLLKQFLRDLPEPVLTTALMPKFEESATIRSEDKKVEAFSKLLDQLPLPNRLLLSWMIVHMSHIIHNHHDNKMSLQNVSIVLSPTMQISHRVLNIFFSHCHRLFKDTTIKRYVPPLKPASSKWSLELPDTPVALEEELAKQESLLSQLHEDMRVAGVDDAAKHEQLWEVQRMVTQLKRKIKFARKALEAAEKRKKENTTSKVPITQIEVLDLQLQREPTVEASGEPAAEKENRPDGFENGSVEVVDIRSRSRQESGGADVENCGEEDLRGEEVVKAEVTTGVVVEKVVANGLVEDVVAEEVHAEEVIIEDESKRMIDNCDKSKDDDVGEGETNDRDAAGEQAVPKISTKERSGFEDYDDYEESAAVGEHFEFTQTDGEKPVADDDGGRGEIVADDLDSDYTAAVDFTLHSDRFTGSDAVYSDLPVDLSTPKKKYREAGEAKTALHLHSRSLQEVLTPIKVSMHGDFGEGDGVTGPLNLVKDKYSDKAGEEPLTEELQELKDLETTLILEEEELLAIGDELHKKLETEQREIERLKQEITELQFMRQDSDCEDYNSSSSDTSNDSEDDDELQDVLSQLISENEALEKKNAALCQKIHEERMVCLGVKVQIRLIQQRQLQSDNILDRDNPF